MINRYFVLVGLLLNAILPCRAIAQPFSPDNGQLPISLNQSIQYAVDSRTEIKLAETRIDSARAKKVQALSRFYPSLDFNVTNDRIHTYDRFSGVTATASFAGNPVVVEVDNSNPRYNITPSLRLNYDLYTGGRDTSVLKQSEAANRSAELDSRMATKFVIKDVSINYFLLRRAYINYQLAQQWEKHARQREDIAKTQLSIGHISESNFRAESLFYSERKLNLITIEKTFQARLIDYLTSMEAKMDPDIVKHAQKIVFSKELNDEINLVMKWKEDELEVDKARVDLESAKNLVAAERAAYAPQVNLHAQYTGAGRGDSSFYSAAKDFGRRDFSVGLTISINLFSGLNTQAKVQEAQAEYDRAALLLEKTSSRLPLARQKMQANYEMELAQENFFKERRALHLLRLKIIQTKVDVKMEKPVNLEMAKIELIEMEQAIDIAKIDKTIAWLNLLFGMANDGANSKLR